jgi:3'-phosphoadenosine 5'-phosphosulfate sulfotransferase (PAPS reductase)/FAD synthetase
MVKDQPGEDFIREAGINVEVTGVTRYESLYRRCLSPITIFKKSPIIRINPVYDWNEREIWSYIKVNKLSYNPLYDLKYRRVGCWCCPLNGVTHYKRLRKTHHFLYNFLLNFEPVHPIVYKLENQSCAGGVSP